MKSILAFGDSNCWGLAPGQARRLDFAQRWPSRLEAGLANTRVIAEGLPGRTTMLDDARAVVDRNGAKALPMLLASHLPLDLVVIMLGTNDLKTHLGGTPASVAQGIRTLVGIVREFPYSHEAEIPEILVVSPPHIRILPGSRLAGLFPVGDAGSANLSPILASVSADMDCSFCDAAEVCTASVEDGVHIDAAAAEALAGALISVAAPLLQVPLR